MTVQEQMFESSINCGGITHPEPLCCGTSDHGSIVCPQSGEALSEILLNQPRYFGVNWRIEGSG